MIDRGNPPRLAKGRGRPAHEFLRLFEMAGEPPALQTHSPGLRKKITNNGDDSTDPIV